MPDGTLPQPAVGTGSRFSSRTSLPPLRRFDERRTLPQRRRDRRTRRLGFRRPITADTSRNKSWTGLAVCTVVRLPIQYCEWVAQPVSSFAPREPLCSWVGSQAILGSWRARDAAILAA
jgi:hypothetical protein